METVNEREILDVVKSVIFNLNITNFDITTRQIITLRVKTVETLKTIAYIIYDRVLNRKKFTILYAKLCAFIINDSEFNKPEDSEITFQQILIRKCYQELFSYKTHQQKLEELKEKFKRSKEMVPSTFKNVLNSFIFKYYNKLFINCKFISELFNENAVSKKIILQCIEKLSKEKDNLQIQCLCIILKLVGPKLSKTNSLDSVVDHLSSFLNENSIENNISSTVKSLLLEIQNMNLNDWTSETTDDSIVYIEKNYYNFEGLPIELKENYELQSYSVMSSCIFEECYDILFEFVNKKEIDVVIHLLTDTNSWVSYNQVSFVVAMILVAIEENQSIRTNAGILLDYLVKEQFLSSHSVRIGANEVLDDVNIKKGFPDLLHLVSDITNKFKFE